MFGIGGRPKRRRRLVQYAVGDEHERLLASTREWHDRYCSRHGIEYHATDRTIPIARSPHWRKVELLIEAFADGCDQVVWLDTDCVIVDTSFDIFAASGFGVAVCECFDSPVVERHLNTGFLLATGSPDVVAFLHAWNAMPPGGKWEDQSGFIELMAARPHRDLLTILPNRFICLDVHMEARDPIISAFHGDPERHLKLPALVSRIRGSAGR